MANQIERDVYVLQSKVKNPIEYVRLTNAIPIIFHFRDYDIPASSSADPGRLSLMMHLFRGMM